MLGDIAQVVDLADENVFGRECGNGHRCVLQALLALARTDNYFVQFAGGLLIGSLGTGRIDKHRQTPGG